MATENVKILLRRGFRDEITSATLDTGELGFTTDTNQLFVGTDDAVNAIQFDPFANAHAVIQSWLDSDDCPYPGLTVNEDLTIELLNDEDIHTILDSMRYFTQELTIEGGVDNSIVGENIYQYKNFINEADEIEPKLHRKGEVLGVAGDQVTVKVREQQLFGWRVESSKTTTSTESIVAGTEGIEDLKIFVNKDPNLHGLTPGAVDEYFVPVEVTYDNGNGTDETLTYANDEYTYEFVKDDNRLLNHILITFKEPVVDHKVVQSTDIFIATYEGPHDAGDFIINPTYKIGGPDEPANRYIVKVDDVVQVEDVDYTITETNFVFTSLPSDNATVTIVYERDDVINEDGEISFHVELNDSDNFWFSLDKNESRLSTDLKVTEISGAYEFLASLYGREKRNVEVITENSFNQMFADQHLSSLDVTTGLRSSLNKKVLLGNVDEIDPTIKKGTFLRYNKDICTTFFIDYSLVQTDSTSKFLRVGQIKVINGVPQGINQVKLTDDNTEMWQDDSDDIADLDEFSNIEFDTVINGDNIEINFTQDVSFETEISYVIKRWSM